MAYWLQRVLLSFILLALISSSQVVWAANADKDISAFDVNTELFELGLSLGLINIEDFGSEFSFGLSANFMATEDFFLQLNYTHAKASLSSFELSQGQLFDGNDRYFQHFDFLLGYNLFQGEVFWSGAKANLSTFYLVAGVGDTIFGGEAAFTFTLGAGYQMALSRQVMLRFDLRDYIYTTNLIGEDNSTHNLHMITTISYLF